MSTPSTERRRDDLAIITCSYGPDFQRCERLCRSVDRWVPGNIAHRLVVPSRDLDRFRALESARRTVIAVEDAVPGGFRQLPLGDRWWLDSGGWPVRGWIMQQVTKLSANFVSPAELLLFADSDMQFIRPFNPRRVLRDGQLRLHRIPGAKDSGEHLGWHHRAADLLGMQRRYFGSDYVGQMITWRRSNLEALQSHLEQALQRPWYRCVARSLRISEYILYGAFVEGVLGLAQSGHYGCADDPCHCCWFAGEADDLASGRSVLQRNAIAVLLQSNLGLSDDTERRILQRIQLSDLSMEDC